MNAEQSTECYKTKAEKEVLRLKELKKWYPNTWLYDLPDRERLLLEELIDRSKSSGAIRTTHFLRDRLEAALEDLGYRVTKVSVSNIPDREDDIFLSYEEVKN